MLQAPIVAAVRELLTKKVYSPGGQFKRRLEHERGSLVEARVRANPCLLTLRLVTVMVCTGPASVIPVALPCSEISGASIVRFLLLWC